MEEILQKIRISSLRKGHSRVEPPVLRGTSGFFHTFSLLVAMDGTHCAFDIYDTIGKLEVLRTTIKTLDTRSSGYIIARSSKVGPGARKIAREYGMSLFTAEEIDNPAKSDEGANPVG